MLRRYYEHVYRRGRPWWEDLAPGTELLSLIASGRVRPGRAIELGCGPGRNAIFLAQRGFDVTAIDFSATTIERARKRAEATGVELRLVVADITTLRDVGEPFDLVVDYGSMDDMVGSARSRYSATISHLTTAGSLCLLVSRAWPPRWWVRIIPFAWRPGELTRALEPEFEVEELPAQPGSVALLARKSD